MVLVKSQTKELALEVSLTNKASFLAVLLQKDISKLIELLNTTKDSLDHVQTVGIN